MASPSAAPRPWPTWSGPVGLAETNSTLTLSPAPAVERPDLPPVAAEARGHPRELGAQRVAHSEAAFFDGLVSGFGAGLVSAFPALSALGVESGLDSAAGFSDSALRGPLPSLP